MSRKPLRAGLDAELVLMPLKGATERVVALFKRTYAIDQGRCVRAAAQPLLYDWRAPTKDERPLLGGSDFWLEKGATDVVVQGSAHAAAPVRELVAGMAIGRLSRQVQVWGERAIVWRQGRPRFGEPKPFSDMPLTWDLAYGGIDWRVAVPGLAGMSAEERHQAALRTTFDHPGMYPRNPFGRGYIVEPGAVEGLVAPSLEDPADPLTEDRLVVGDATQWWRQPLPAGLGWTSPVSFPRLLWFGRDSDPWFPAPDGPELPEVARGLLPPHFLAGRCHDGGIDQRFYQGAVPGLTITRPPTGLPISFTNLHPKHPRVETVLPPTAAEVTFVIEGKHTKREARLHHIVCQPGQLSLSLVFAAEAELPRPFIPGVHKHIPISAQLDDEEAVPFVAPVPLREQLAAAMTKKDR